MSDKLNKNQQMPLAAYIVLSARKNAIPLVGGPLMTLAFSDLFLTWGAMYDGNSDAEGAVAWKDVSKIDFRRGQGLFRPPKMAIVLNSGREIVFDVAYPGFIWRRLRKGLTSIGASDLLRLLGPRPDSIELNGLYFGAPWIMFPIVVLLAIAASILQTWYLLIAATLGISGLAHWLYHLVRPRSPVPYPRIIDAGEAAASLK
jgi:hypothetical protein